MKVLFRHTVEFPHVALGLVPEVLDAIIARRGKPRTCVSEQTRTGSTFDWRNNGAQVKNHAILDLISQCLRFSFMGLRIATGRSI